jgi:predicted transposase YbfD/YdcC
MWVKTTSLASPTDPLAVDGKTVRGASTAERDAPICFPASRTTAKKSGPSSLWAKKPTRSQKPANCFPPCPLADRSVRLNEALHSHRQLWRLLRSKHAYPLCVIKGNEPTLQADLATYFADPHAQFLQAETIDRQRGRVERRAIQVSSEMGSSLQACWPGVSHVAQLTRTRTEKNKTTVEVVYLIAILPSGSDGPQSLLALSRGHWGIENSLHYVRDVTFAEDRSRIRTGHAPQLLAACRNLAIILIHRSGSLTLQLRVARSLIILALLLTSCFPWPPPSNNSQALSPRPGTGVCSLGQRLLLIHDLTIMPFRFCLQQW